MVSSSTRASPLVMLLAAIFFLSSQVFAASAVLGVDLGTEYIKAALVKPGIPLDIVLTKDSRRKETSAVAFKPSRAGVQDGQYPERLYGSDAIALSARFPGEVYPNLKPLLGLPVDDYVVQEYAARHPALQLQAHSTRGTAAFKSNTISAEEDAWMVEELLAMELQSVQKNAEAAAGDGSTVRNIVLTVPPFYTTEEKRAVQSAAELAGLKVLSMISDGLAVGLNYATSRQFPNINEGSKPEYHMVFDMGAGSTKASVIRFQSRNVKDTSKFNKTIQEVQLLGSGWDRTFGGDTLNNLIVDDMVAQFVESKGAKKVSATTEGVKAHGRAMAKLTKEAERLRHVLSANQNTQTSFEGLYEDVDFKYKITRAEFETMAEAHGDRVGAAIKDALKMSGLEIQDLDSIILHGGASRTPFVQKSLEKIVGSADKLRSNVNSDEAAVFGAGFRAAELSPSFRVKEIRISEGSAYPVGMKWTGSNGKDQTQRLWTPTSPLGGPTKEYTFTEESDFTATFYQQIGDEYKDVKSFTTKNLTSTVEFVKEKYPSCVESGIFFRVAAKLNGENGGVQIVKAAVECEAEAKEGLMDGVKNLFGFGKKDQEPLQGEGETAETETVSPEGTSSEKADPSSTSANPDSSESAAADAAEGETGSTEEMKADVKKVEHISIPVDYSTSKLGTPQLSKAQLTKSKDRLKAFAASDKARVQREEALNQLEAYTYKIRDLVEDEGFVSVSTESERQKLAEKASEASEWLYDDGADAPKDELKAKLKELQEMVSPIQKRKEEAEKRPELLSKLQKTLESTSAFVEGIKKQIDEYEAWHTSASASEATSSTSEQAPEASASENDGLEDDTPAEKTMEDVLEERGPVPPLYKREDLKELEEIAKSTQEWLEGIVPKQEALSATADPVLLAKDLNAKAQKIEMVGKDLALKGVKNFDGKKKKKTDKDNKKSSGSKTASADPAQQTIKFGNKNYSPDEIEEMINKMTEEDWKQVEEQITREKAEKEKEKGQQEQEPAHDEL
ncbi:lumenal Hsp70 protein [Amphichorda felina]